LRTCSGEIDIARLRPGPPRLNGELRIQDFLTHHRPIPFSADVVERLADGSFAALANVVIRGAPHEPYSPAVRQ
jgi:hypothetical protein